MRLTFTTKSCHVFLQGFLCESHGWMVTTLMTKEKIPSLEELVNDIEKKSKRGPPIKYHDSLHEYWRKAHKKHYKKTR